LEGAVGTGAVPLFFFGGQGRDWPAKRVSGDAVRRMLREGGGMDECLISGAGSDELLTSWLITSLSDVLKPVWTCQGDRDFPFEMALGRGCDVACCSACCCCFLRSFCETLCTDAVVAAFSFSFWAEKPMERFEVRLVEAWAIISFMPSFDEESGVDDHGFPLGVEGSDTEWEYPIGICGLGIGETSS